MNSHCLALPDFSSDSSNQRVHQVLLGSSLFVLRSRNSLKALSWSNCRVCLACFLWAASDISVPSEPTVNLYLERTRNIHEKSFCPSSEMLNAVIILSLCYIPLGCSTPYSAVSSCQLITTSYCLIQCPIICLS